MDADKGHRDVRAAMISSHARNREARMSTVRRMIGKKETGSSHTEVVEHCEHTRRRNMKMAMIKSSLLIILLLPATIRAETFKDYLVRFFADSSFQITHIQFPLSGEICLLSAKGDSTTREDTVFANTGVEWKYISYGYGRQGVLYKKSKELPKPLREMENVTYIELYEEESCYNLSLGFVKKGKTWFLVYMGYFET